MSLRGSLLESLAGDLEYHPRRAALYLFLAAASLSFWIFSPPENKFTTTPLVFALGSLTLCLKGIYPLRKSSEGIGLTRSDIDALPSSRGKKLPEIPAQAAQIVQDFGAGSLLLWPLVTITKDIHEPLTDPLIVSLFIAGAVLFGLGWLIRRLTSQ